MAIYELHGRSPHFPANGQYYIAGSAEVIGNVRLGSNTSIWFGSVLRGGDASLGVRLKPLVGLFQHLRMGQQIGANPLAEVLVRNQHRLTGGGRHREGHDGSERDA